MERTLEEIEQEIAKTKEELKNVHGTETEVYARIVGYYRTVKNWNKGKRDEFNLRKNFTLEDSKKQENSNQIIKEEEISSQNENNSTKSSISFEIYTKKTCPNCPPVKNYVSKLNIEGFFIDVDTDDGLSTAAKKGVFATPTVIFYNEDGIETSRCHTVEELEKICNKIPVNV